jgi:hypothetical protein
LEFAWGLPDVVAVVLTVGVVLGAHLVVALIAALVEFAALGRVWEGNALGWTMGGAGAGLWNAS